jgi:hypothetical protein
VAKTRVKHILATNSIKPDGFPDICINSIYKTGFTR